MSVFRTNAQPSDSVMSESAFLARRASIAAIHRDRLARERAEEASRAKLELINRYQTIMAEKAANNGIPPALVKELGRTDLTPFERVALEQTIAGIVRQDRRYAVRTGIARL